MTLTWNTVGAFSYAAAAAAIFLHFTGCADYPTNASKSESGSAPVIRPPQNGGCVPEVFTSSSETADTVMTTFTAVVTTENGCYPNLTAWGIDMADGVGVDTPQGDSHFHIRYHNIVNPPSPSLAAVGADYSPPQVMIEFDPPVGSVQFYYSRRANARAWWGEIVNTDSTAVTVRSRIPGTTFYQTWGRQVLYSNSSQYVNDGWDSVKFQTSSDLIQWLWIDGHMAIDNLKIVRRPLTCTPSSVQRGQQLTCDVKPGTGWSVTSWEFIPEGSGGTAAALRRDPEPGTEDLLLTATSNSALPTVVENTTSRVWAGPVAVGGTVRVHLTDGAQAKTYATQFTVTPRPTDWKSQWSYRQGPEQTVADREVASSGDQFGRNCPEQFAVEAACIATVRSRLQPDPRLQPDDGYTATMFTSGGNKGYWYVSSIRYNMRRVGNVHPGMLVTSPRKHPVPSTALTKDCKRGLGLSPKATSGNANMNQFNQFCGPLGIDMTVFVPAIWNHEGFGTNGGVGHEDLGRAAAGESQNNPYTAIEGLVGPDSLSLVAEIAGKVVPIGDDITLKAADNNAVNGGPKGNYDRAHYPGREMWFWEVGSGGFLTWVRRPLNQDY